MFSFNMSIFLILRATLAAQILMKTSNGFMLNIRTQGLESCVNIGSVHLVYIVYFLKYVYSIFPSKYLPASEEGAQFLPLSSVFRFQKRLFIHAVHLYTFKLRSLVFETLYCLMNRISSDIFGWTKQQQQLPNTFQEGVRESFSKSVSCERAIFDSMIGARS